MDKFNKKKKYTPPMINVFQINFENSISAMSTTVNPGDANNQVELEDWSSGQDVSNDLAW